MVFDMPRIYDKRQNRFVLIDTPKQHDAFSFTKIFLQTSAVISFLAFCGIAGFVVGGRPVQCATIATVLKVAGMCDTPREIRMVKP